MKIVKVFTKYDTPPICILVPYFKNLEVQEYPVVIDSTSFLDMVELKPTSVIEGLDNVKVVTYEDKNEVL